MTAVLHVGLDYLDRLPATEVVAYGIAALERQAHDILRSLMLFRLPVEAWGGERKIFDQLRREAMWWLGQGKSEQDEMVERRKRREAQVTKDIVALMDAGDEAGAAELERLYAAECAKMDAEEVAAIRAANTISGDQDTIKALKRFLTPAEAA